MIARVLFYSLSAMLIVASTFVVPMPLAELVPGGSTPVTEIVQIEGTSTTAINGSLELLTIRVKQPSLVGAVEAWISPEREIQRRDQVIPPSIDESEYFRLQRQQFQQAFEVAAGVGLRAAGYEVEIATRPVVFSVLPGGPAADALRAGDRIIEVNGEDVRSAEQLIELLIDVRMGETISLTVARDDETVDVEVRAGSVPDLDRPGLGVIIQTLASEISLPFEVSLDEETRIGGPSAGMMVALTVYDLVSEDDLAAGRTIAGTGTIDGEGNVGPIGGIQEKVFSARDAGADLMLVPAAQAEQAQAVAPAGLEVIGVATLDEAIEALER
ncbi:MAG: PDZ domain-containing protein [Nitriliruptorales bacterium]|nr:PDZ domain-containing protein [Nitriliruptorales bacterium]